MIVAFLLACALDAPATAQDAPTCAPEAPRCNAGPVAEQGPRSVTGAALAVCSTDPMTGWYRDGRCRTDAQDRGLHTVCATMTAEFLGYTKRQGNDLSTARGSFPGLAPGDRWCLCASRWEEARQAGHAPTVVLEATNHKALSVVREADLRAHVSSN